MLSSLFHPLNMGFRLILTWAHWKVPVYKETWLYTLASAQKTVLLPAWLLYLNVTLCKTWVHLGKENQYQKISTFYSLSSWKFTAILSLRMSATKWEKNNKTHGWLQQNKTVCLFINLFFIWSSSCVFFLVNNYVKNESAQCSHIYKEHTAELSFSSQPTAASLLRQTPSVHLSSQSSLVWLQQGGCCFPSSPCWTPRYRKPNKNSHYLHRILIIEFCND